MEKNVAEMSNKIKEIRIGNISFKVSEDCFPKGTKEGFASEWFKEYWTRVGEGEWEPQTFEIFRRFLDKEHSYLDIGAWIGPTVLYGCQLAEHCYAIEPDPIAIKKLRENINLNPLLKNKIGVHELAITDKNGQADLGNARDYFGNSMSGILFKSSGKSFEVKSIRLEDFIEENKIENLNFIKIDIEGGEVVVLPDSKRYLEENKPTIHLSLHPFWFENLEQDSEKIIDSIRKYKSYFDNKGKRLSLNEIRSRMLKKEGFDIVITDKGEG
ncbi:MAG: FkbM family methyltransferase [archaeon]